MKKEFGASAGVLALFAVLFHTQFRGVEGNSGPAPVSRSSQARNRQQPAPAEEPREGPWIATRAFFNGGDLEGDDAQVHDVCGSHRRVFECLIEPAEISNREALRSVLGLGSGVADRYSIWSMVVTVADPLHTRLPLLLDRQIEAIQASLQSAHWELSGQWLPWMDHFDASETDIRERRTQRRLQRAQEQLPGVLIFRKFEDRAHNPAMARRCLFVFLAPETPVNGIAGPSFIAAMHLANAVSTGRKIGLIAPSFSGSFASLATLITKWNTARSGVERRIEGTVFGSTATSQPEAKTFSDLTGLAFQSAAASSEDYGRAFCNLLDAYGIKEAEAAYLKEDETAYGQSYGQEAARKSPCNVRSLVFPRDISHLRNVYQEQTPGAVRGPAAPETGVTFSIKDPNSGEDAVPVFADTQTPVSQNAVIDGIVDDLRRKRTRLVYIVATNALDKLFLARVVRQEAPDTRIATTNADILFIPAAAQYDLSGMLFLSPYPGFLEGDEWTAAREQSGTQQRMSSGADFEAVYNAVQAALAGMLRPLGPQPSGTWSGFRGYRQLFETKAHPAIWLLQLNRSGFSPVDVFDEWHAKNVPEDMRIQHERWYAADPNAVSDAGPGARPRVPLPMPPRGWDLTAVLFTTFVLWSCFLAWRCNTGNQVRRPVNLALGHGRWLSAPRLVAMTAAALALSAIEWILFLPAWASDFAPQNPVLNGWKWTAAVIAGGGAGWFTPLLVAGFLWRTKRPARLGMAWAYAGVLASFYVAIVGIWAWMCALQRIPARKVFFCFRALQLYSGLSPAAPFLIIAVTAFIGALFYLVRFSDAGLGRPRLRVVAFGNLPALQGFYREVNRRMIAPAGLRGNEWKTRGAVSALLFVAAFAALCRYGTPVENHWYDDALAAAVAILLVMLANACRDLVFLWDALKNFLELVDFFPLRDAFRRVARYWPRRPIWVSNRRLARPLMAKQMVTALLHRRVALFTSEAQQDVLDFWEVLPKRFKQADTLYPEPHRNVPMPAAPAPHAPPPPAVSVGVGAAAQPALERQATPKPVQPKPIAYFAIRGEYQNLCAKLATTIMRKDLMPLWRWSLEEQRSREPRTNDENGKLRESCGDFVALQFSRYIIYVVGQIQMMAWSISLSLVMLMLVLNSYSPQAPMLLGRALAVIFLVAGFFIVRIFASMERNPVLSIIAGTKPGALNYGFWVQMIAMGALPLLGVLVHLFPSMSNFLYSWVAPGVEAMH